MSIVQTTVAAELVAVPAKRRGGFWHTFIRNPKAVVGLGIFLVFTLMSVWPGLFTSVGDPNELAFAPAGPPSADHILGTTALGQDIWAQLVFGARQSLVVAVVAGGCATVLSVLVGVTAAYLGGIVDDVLSLLTNAILVIPAFPLIIIFAKYAGQGGLLVILAVLIFTGWSYGANQLRAQALSLRNRDFLEAARVRGERRSYIIVAEVLPNLASLIVATFLNAALYSVLTAAGLQFLGLGDSNSVSWGTMLYWSQNQQALQTGMPLWSLAPGLCVALLGASFALMNYSFDEISSPALRSVRRNRARRSGERGDVG